MTHICLDTTVISDGCTTKDLSLENEIISAEIVNNTFLSALNTKISNVKSTKKY